MNEPGGTQIAEPTLSVIDSQMTSTAALTRSVVVPPADEHRVHIVQTPDQVVIQTPELRRTVAQITGALFVSGCAGVGLLGYVLAMHRWWWNDKVPFASAIVLIVVGIVGSWLMAGVERGVHVSGKRLRRYTAYGLPFVDFELRQLHIQTVLDANQQQSWCVVAENVIAAERHTVVDGLSSHEGARQLASMIAAHAEVPVVDKLQA